MSAPRTTRAPRRCRGCRKQVKRSDALALPNGVQNPFCAPCVQRARQRILDKQKAKDIKHSWEVAR